MPQSLQLERTKLPKSLEQVQAFKAPPVNNNRTIFATGSVTVECSPTKCGDWEIDNLATDEEHRGDGVPHQERLPRERDQRSRGDAASHRRRHAL